MLACVPLPIRAMTPAPAWNPEHVTLLVGLRQEKGLDHHQLAKLSSLSPPQVLELETPESVAQQRSAFYSPLIKAHAGHRLIEKLRSLPSPQA